MAVKERTQNSCKPGQLFGTCMLACLVRTAGIMTKRPLSAKRMSRKETWAVPAEVELGGANFFARSRSLFSFTDLSP